MFKDVSVLINHQDFLFCHCYVHFIVVQCWFASWTIILLMINGHTQLQLTILISLFVCHLHVLYDYIS